MSGIEALTGQKLSNDVFKRAVRDFIDMAPNALDARDAFKALTGRANAAVFRAFGSESSALEAQNRVFTVYCT